MRMIVYEGSPAEIAELQRLSAMENVPAPLEGAGATDAGVAGNETAGGKPVVSTEIAYRALTRIPLSEGQRAVVVAIYRAHPNWIWADQLQEITGYSTSQFAGLMGAFGRRLTNTPGYVDYTWILDQEWDPAKGCVRYRFPEAVRRAIEKARLV